MAPGTFSRPKDSGPWLLLKDVCQILDITNHKMTAQRLDHDEVSQADLIDSLGRNQATTIINESGLYNVILRSDKPEEMTKAIPKASADRGNQYTGGKATTLSGSQKSKPETILDLGFSPKLIAPEKATAMRAEIRAIQKV